MNSGTDRMSREEFRRYVARECQAIRDYQWNLGIVLGRDPRLDRTENDIALEWITNHAASFRIKWNHNRSAPPQ